MGTITVYAGVVGAGVEEGCGTDGLFVCADDSGTNREVRLSVESAVAAALDLSNSFLCARVFRFRRASSDMVRPAKAVSLASLASTSEIWRLIASIHSLLYF